MSVVASLIVRFGQGADPDALVKMEFDARLNVDDAGEEKSSFYPGDSVFFLIHHDSSLRIGRVAATHGQVVRQNVVGRERKQTLLFAEASDTHELEYNPAGAITRRWYGNEAAGWRRTGRQISIGEGGRLPAQCLLTYEVAFQGYRLAAPRVELAKGESYPITIVAWMEAA